MDSATQVTCSPRPDGPEWRCAAHNVTMPRTCSVGYRQAVEREFAAKLSALEAERDGLEGAYTMAASENGELKARLARVEGIILGTFGMSTDKGRIAASKAAREYITEYLPPAALTPDATTEGT